MTQIIRLKKAKPSYWRRNNKRFADKMRRKKTPAEKVLWPLLKPLGFKSQVVIFGYIADFLDGDTRIIIEADGLHHQNIETKEYDEVRDWNLFRHGYKVLRFPNSAIISNPHEIIEQIKAHNPLKIL